MNGCEAFENLMSRSFFGEIENSEAEELRAHLKSCESCRKHAVSLKRTFSLTSPKIVGGKDVPPALWKRIDRTIESESAKLTYIWVSVATAAAAIIVALVLAFSITSSDKEIQNEFAGNGKPPTGNESAQQEKDILPPAPKKQPDLTEENDELVSPDSALVRSEKEKRTSPQELRRDEKSALPGAREKDVALSPGRNKPDKPLVPRVEAPDNTGDNDSSRTGLAGIREAPGKDIEKLEKQSPEKDETEGLLAVTIDGGSLRLVSGKESSGGKLTGFTILEAGSALRSSAGQRAVLSFSEELTSVVFNTNTELKVEEVEGRTVLTLIEGEILVDAEEDSSPICVRAGDFSVRIDNATGVVEYKKRTKKFKATCLSNKIEVAGRGNTENPIEFQSCAGHKTDLAKPIEANGIREAKWALKVHPELKLKLSAAAQRVAMRRTPILPDGNKKRPDDDNIPIPPGTGQGQQPGGNQGGGQRNPRPPGPQQPGGGCPGGGQHGGGGHGGGGR